MWEAYEWMSGRGTRGCRRETLWMALDTSPTRCGLSICMPHSRPHKRYFQLIKNQKRGSPCTEKLFRIVCSRYKIWLWIMWLAPRVSAGDGREQCISPICTTNEVENDSGERCELPLPLLPPTLNGNVNIWTAIEIPVSQLEATSPPGSVIDLLSTCFRAQKCLASSLPWNAIPKCDCKGYWKCPANM